MPVTAVYRQAALARDAADCPVSLVVPPMQIVRTLDRLGPRPTGSGTPAVLISPDQPVGARCKVLLTGRLTRDPEMRSLGRGKSVTQFSVATNEYVGGGKEKAEYQFKGKVSRRVLTRPLTSGSSGSSKMRRDRQLRPVRASSVGYGGPARRAARSSRAARRPLGSRSPGSSRQAATIARTRIRHSWSSP